MDPRAHPDPAESRPSPALSPSPVITPTKSHSRALLTDLAGWPSYSDMRSQVPGAKNVAGPHQPGTLTSVTSSKMAPTPTGAYQHPSHLPTPQSPGNIAPYLLTRTPTYAQNNSLQPEHQPDMPPREFQSHASSSSASLRSHSIPTPESSPLIARTRSGPSHVQPGRTDGHDDSTGSVTPSKKGDVRSLASTPPRTPSRQASTRPLTPVLQSRPTTPSQLQSTASHPDNLASMGPTSQKVKEEFGDDTARIAKQLSNTARATDSHQSDYSKRIARFAPSSSTGKGGAAPAPDSGGKDGSLLWSSGYISAIDSPIKGKRTALFQETSEESFEESLMAGGYGNYGSDRPLWKLDGEGEAPNQAGDAMREGKLVDSGLPSTEEEKRKKARLAAFCNRPRVLSSIARLMPVEVEGCGKVLMKVDHSEPQIPPKPTPKAKRSRKRKKTSVDAKHETDRNGVLVPEPHVADRPNWPDMEFPWRSRMVTADGLSSTEREERLRYISSFLDRESDEEEEWHSSSGCRSPDERPSQSPRSSGDKTIPLLTPRRGSTVSAIPIDPADARVALLCKRSIRAVQLRLLRRRNNDHNVDGDDDEVLCVCQGRDDGRPLVQCDACRRWYHLECIGIQSTSELGREEDPWFCADCVEVKTPPPVGIQLEPTLVPTVDGEEEDVYDPPFLNAGLHPSPATPWTRAARVPTTPPRMQHVVHAVSGSSWDEPPSSSSRGNPRTPSASAFGDTVRVYGTTPGRSVEGLLSTSDETVFDPTSTPSRGIMFGLPFTTPKDGRWGMGSLPGGHELFHTPQRPGDGATAYVRYGGYHDRVGQSPEEGSSEGVFRATGGNNVTPVERDTLKRMQVLESPLGTKRSRRTVRSS